MSSTREISDDSVGSLPTMLLFGSIAMGLHGLGSVTRPTRCSSPAMTTLYDMCENLECATSKLCAHKTFSSRHVCRRPVSNHGARVRMLMYKLGLEGAVNIMSPMDIGGLRSEEYLALNPQGKMPLLVDDDTVVWEADAICRHLLEKHADSAVSM